MENSKLLNYVETLYPFLLETDGLSKQINTLMAVRRTAFLLGVQYSHEQSIKESETARIS